jgi:ribosome-associated toxin RatA of RatAB toxin-antitoxin module
MTKIDRSALVPYGPAQMYALVDDVPRYPEFLPWCEAAEVHVDEGAIQEASLHIAKGPFRDSVRTRNTRIPGERIELALMEGPFRSLVGCWSFEPLGTGGEGSKVSLTLGFDFRNAMIAGTLSPVFASIADGMVDAFVSRAKALYG